MMLPQRPRRTLLSLLAVVVLVVLVVGCGGAEAMTGVIVDVRSTSLTHVESFTVQGDDGQRLTFVVDASAGRGDHSLSPSHLRQHMGYGDRVTVGYRRDGEVLVATDISDQ